MEKRTETIGFKVSASEKMQILKTLTSLGFENKNEFLRTLVLDQILLLNNNEMDPKERISNLEQEVEQLERELAELKKENFKLKDLDNLVEDIESLE